MSKSRLSGVLNMSGAEEETGKKAEQSFDRYQGLMRVRIACIVVLGVLIFQLVQGWFEDSPMPAWFIPAMIAMIAGISGLLVWNYFQMKEYNKSQSVLSHDSVITDDGQNSDEENA